MVADIQPTDPPSPPDPGVWVKRFKYDFFRAWSYCISNLMESRMQQNGNKYFARRPPPPPPTLGVGSKGQNSTFSEYGHVAFQIKGSDEYSSMVTTEHGMDGTTTTTLGEGSKGNTSTFSEHGHV